MSVAVLHSVSKGTERLLCVEQSLELFSDREEVEQVMLASTHE